MLHLLKNIRTQTGNKQLLLGKLFWRPAVVDELDALLTRLLMTTVIQNNSGRLYCILDCVQIINSLIKNLYGLALVIIHWP